MNLLFYKLNFNYFNGVIYILWGVGILIFRTSDRTNQIIEFCVTIECKQRQKM